MQWSIMTSRGITPDPRGYHTATAVCCLLARYKLALRLTLLHSRTGWREDRVLWRLRHARVLQRRRGLGHQYVPQPMSLMMILLLLLRKHKTHTHSCSCSCSCAETQNWSRKKLPAAKCRYCHTATAVGPWIFVFGGCDGSDYVDQLDVLNTGTPPAENGSPCHANCAARSQKRSNG